MRQRDEVAHSHDARIRGAAASDDSKTTTSGEASFAEASDAQKERLQIPLGGVRVQGCLGDEPATGGSKHFCRVQWTDF